MLKRAVFASSLVAVGVGYYRYEKHRKSTVLAAYRSEWVLGARGQDVTQRLQRIRDLRQSASAILDESMERKIPLERELKEIVQREQEANAQCKALNHEYNHEYAQLKIASEGEDLFIAELVQTIHDDAALRQKELDDETTKVFHQQLALNKATVAAQVDRDVADTITHNRRVYKFL